MRTSRPFALALFLAWRALRESLSIISPQTSLLRRSKFITDKFERSRVHCQQDAGVPSDKYFLEFTSISINYFSFDSVKNLELKAVVRRVFILIKSLVLETMTLFAESVVPVER